MSTKKAFGCLPDISIFILLCLFSLLLVVSCFATNRYVDKTTGNDANDGLATNSAYATIGKAATVVNAGDIVHIRAGVYTNERPTLSRTGSAASPIVWRPYNAEAVSVGGFVLQTHYQTIQDFSIYGPAGPAFAGMIYAYGVYTNNTILGCTFGDGNTSCYKIYMRQTTIGDPTTGPQNWIVASNTFTAGTYNETPVLQIAGQNCVASQNTFHSIQDSDCTRVIGYNHVLRSNIFYNITNPTAAIHQDILQMFTSGGVVASNVLFECNVITNVEAQILNITATTDPEGVKYVTIRNNLFAAAKNIGAISCRNVTVENNTFWYSIRNTGGVGFRNADGGTAHNAICRNNIFVGVGSDPTSASQGWYFVDAGVTNFYADYNFVCGISNAAKGITFTETHGVNGGDPLFTATNSWDFSLQALSPAVNVGTNLSSIFTKDIHSNTRGTLWDIGAYEYIAPTNSTVLRPRQPERTSWILNRLYHLIGRNRKPRKCYAKKTRNTCRARR